MGYATQVLWPLCHITLDRVAYRKAWWDAYVAMNQRFASTVLDEVRKNPGLVWVHDYHLALLPAMIRAKRPGTSAAVFWHIPWPGPDVFHILPERHQLLEGLLAADTLIFQTAGSAEKFVNCARQFLRAELGTSEKAIDYKGHRCRVTAYPISIDYATLTTLARMPGVERTMAQVRGKLGIEPGVRVGLGVDRLDYTKGLLKRLWALDTFLSRYPQYAGRFIFVQIAVPSRSEVEAYRRYREMIRQTVSEINTRYGSESWHPIEYLEGRIGSDTLLAYYRMADLAVVSSVYDGMNLVAKEYVASQVDESGVLLLSQMAGAAEELTDALIINPYDSEGLADAIRQALEMPTEERQDRMRRMRSYLQTHDIHAWAARCLREAGLLTPIAQWPGLR